MDRAVSLAPTEPPSRVDVVAIIDGIQMVMQPIIDVATGATVAVEALARFSHDPSRSTEAVFAELHSSRYGLTVEAACLRAAFVLRADLPERVLLSVNVSPDVLSHPVIEPVWPRDLDGFIIEVTEQRSTDPRSFCEAVARLRARGARIAVDDVSTGYAGLLRLASLQPGFVKVAREVVAGVNASPAQAAVLQALVSFSHRIGAAVIGEGVETMQDLRALGEFDVDYAQGWAVGRPATTLGPIAPAVVTACQTARRRMLRDSVAVGSTAVQTRDLHAVTASLARASGYPEIHAAVARAGYELGIDGISVSILADGDTLREISSNAAELDGNGYSLADYPATRDVLATGVMIEVHVGTEGDRQEQALLEKFGNSSLLLTALRAGSTPLGLLEFSHRTPRRWTTQDMAHAYGLAEHLVHALERVGGVGGAG